MISELKNGSISLSEIEKMTGGRLVFSGISDAEIDRICTDSREASEGTLFAAIRGERTDGHLYIPRALENGCRAILAEKMPEDSLAMERYLGSGAIKGVGAALAGRIVRHFGEDTLRIVEEEPERLAEVKGISEKKAREIAAQVTEKADMRKAMMFLQKYGISLNLGAKINCFCEI